MTSPQMRADARLIAAAPELLEALEEARLIVANLPHDESLFLAKIDTALAKARGEANAASSASPLAEGTTLHLNDARMEKGQEQ